MIWMLCCVWLQGGQWLPLEKGGEVFLQPDPMMADVGVSLDFDRLKWKGKLVDGKPDGKGTLEGFKGKREVFTYKGHMKAGKMHSSKARLTVIGPSLKFKYSGDYLEGVRLGEGRMDWVKSNMTFDPRLTVYYEGAWKNNLFDGEGAFVQRNEKYVGSFRQGVCHGHGTRYVLYERQPARMQMDDENTQKRLAGTISTDTRDSYFKPVEEGWFENGQFVGEKPAATEPETEKE